jgi:glycine cleavage system H protein
MTFVLVLFTAAIILMFELKKNSRHSRVEVAKSADSRRHASIEITERFFHPGHTWATITTTGDVMIGADDFSGRVIGKLTSVEMPHVNQSVQQGEPIAILHHGRRSLVQVAPLSGRVTEVNRKLYSKPQLLNDSPLERGWIAKIVPTNLTMDVHNLFKGVAADGWREAVTMQLIQRFSPQIGPVLQDGGQLVSDLSDRLSDEEWERVVQQFFSATTTNTTSTTQRTKESRT